MPIDGALVAGERRLGVKSNKMHPGEVEIDAQLVRQLLRTQFPHLCDLPVRAVPSTGTVNAIYRLGDQLCVRLPRVQHWAQDLLKEFEWLPRLAAHLSLKVPEPVAKGDAGSGYPFPWAIYRWIEGETLATDRIADEPQAATDLARFVSELQQVDPSGAPRAGRKPLPQLDKMTRVAIESLRGLVDTEVVMTAWETSLRAPVWDGSPVWIHCDLLPPNVLVEGERLTAVIDFGAAGVGDPAQDVAPAWSVFGRTGRDIFRASLDVDEVTWLRGRGYALHQAALIIPYYSETNPEFVAMARRTVEEIISEVRSGRG